MTAQPHRLAMVLSTTATIEQAQRIANVLVDERLAACVQISGPITSVYRWQGELESSTEYRLVIKMRVDHWPQVRDRITETHPYDEPQILLVPLEAASAGYQRWVVEETTPPPNELSSPG